MLELVRYIHLNPIRAGTVKDLKELNAYPQTGHSTIMGKMNNEWQDTEYVLKLFGQTPRVARKAYHEFVAEGVTLGRRPELVGGGLIRSAGGWAIVKELRSANIRVFSDERILGSSDFVESALKIANEKYEKRTHAIAKGIDVDTLIDIVADSLKIDSNIIKSNSKQKPGGRARAIICYLASERLGISGAQLAHELRLSPSAVSKLISRGRQDGLVKKIDSQLFKL